MAQRRAGKPPVKGKPNAPPTKPAAARNKSGPDPLAALLALSASPLEAHECPIGMAAMDDPVVTSDGHSYERVNIENWFNSKGKRTSPNTNMELPDLRLVPNMALRKSIEEYGEFQAALEAMLRDARVAFESSQSPQAVEEIQTALEAEMQKLRSEHAKAMKAKQADVVALTKKKEQVEKSLNRLTEELAEARAELQRKEGAWKSERSLAVRKREEGEAALRREVTRLQEELNRRQQDVLDSDAAHEEAIKKLAAREEENRVLLDRTKQEQEYTIQVVKALQLMEAENARILTDAVKMEESLQLVSKAVSELKAEAATREQAWTEEKELALKQHQDREEALRRAITRLKTELEQQKTSFNPIKERLTEEVAALQAELRTVRTLLQRAEQAKRNAIIETTSLRAQRVELMRLAAGKEALERQVTSLMQKVAALQAAEAERAGLDRELEHLRQERRKAKKDAQEKLSVLEGQLNDSRLLVETERTVHQQMVNALQLEKEGVQARFRELEEGLRQWEDVAHADREKARREHEAASACYKDEIAALKHREEDLASRSNEFERIIREQNEKHRSEVAQLGADSDARHARTEAAATKKETELCALLEHERNRLKSTVVAHEKDAQRKEDQSGTRAEFNGKAHELPLRDWTPKCQLELCGRSHAEEKSRQQDVQHAAIVGRLEAEHAERLIAQKLQLDGERKAAEEVWTRRNLELTDELKKLQQASREAERRAKDAAHAASAAAKSHIEEVQRNAQTTYRAGQEDMKAQYRSAVKVHQAEKAQYDEHVKRLIEHKQQLEAERKAAEEGWARRNLELTDELKKLQQASREAERRAKDAAHAASAAAESRIKEVQRNAQTTYRAGQEEMETQRQSAVNEHQAMKAQYDKELKKIQQAHQDQHLRSQKELKKVVQQCETLLERHDEEIKQLKTEQGRPKCKSVGAMKTDADPYVECQALRAEVDELTRKLANMTASRDAHKQLRSTLAGYEAQLKESEIQLASVRSQLETAQSLAQANVNKGAAEGTVASTSNWTQQTIHQATTLTPDVAGPDNSRVPEAQIQLARTDDALRVSRERTYLLRDLVNEVADTFAPLQQEIEKATAPSEDVLEKWYMTLDFARTARMEVPFILREGERELTLGGKAVAVVDEDTAAGYGGPLVIEQLKAEYASSNEEQRKLIGEGLFKREGAILRQIVSLKEERQQNVDAIKGTERWLQDLEHRLTQEPTTQAQICSIRSTLDSLRAKRSSQEPVLHDIDQQLSFKRTELKQNAYVHRAIVRGQAPFNTPRPSIQTALMPSDLMITDALRCLNEESMLLYTGNPLLAAVGSNDDGAGVNTCEVIVRLFRLREKDETIIGLVLDAMLRLLASTADDTIVEHLGAAGACEAIPETMQYHDNRDAIVAALTITARLASHVRNKHRFGEANACGMCAEALRLALHSRDRDMARQACLSMCHLGANSEQNQMRLANCGAYELSESCLISFASDHDVQSAGKQLIYVLSQRQAPRLGITVDVSLH